MLGFFIGLALGVFACALVPALYKWVNGKVSAIELDIKSAAVNVFKKVL